MAGINLSSAPVDNAEYVDHRPQGLPPGTIDEPAAIPKGSVMSKPSVGLDTGRVPSVVPDFKNPSFISPGLRSPAAPFSITPPSVFPGGEPSGINASNATAPMANKDFPLPVSREQAIMFGIQNGFKSWQNAFMPMRPGYSISGTEGNVPQVAAPQVGLKFPQDQGGQIVRNEGLQSRFALGRNMERPPEQPDVSHSKGILPGASGIMTLPDGTQRHMVGRSYVDLSPYEQQEIAKSGMNLQSYVRNKMAQDPQQLGATPKYGIEQDTAAQAAAAETQTATGGGRGQGVQGLDIAGLKGNTFNGNPLNDAYQRGKKQPSFQEFADTTAQRTGPGSAGGIAMRERGRNDIITREERQRQSQERMVTAQAGAVAEGARAKAQGPRDIAQMHIDATNALAQMNNKAKADYQRNGIAAQTAIANARNATELQKAEGDWRNKAVMQGRTLRDKRDQDANRTAVKMFDQYTKAMSKYGMAGMPPTEEEAGYAEYNDLSSKRDAVMLGAAQRKDEVTDAELAGGDPTGAPTAQPPTKNGKGWQLHTDKNGAKAYVSPDGKQVEPIG